MSELKAGYWRGTQDGVNAETVELFAERDGNWYGRIVAPVDDPTAWYWSPQQLEGYEYLGPTLPPDPGPGWRLLKKWPEPEPILNGDEPFLHGEWCGMGIMSPDIPTGQQHDVWYRRRETPEPPTPPEGWELLPDGTEWQEGFKRFSTSAYSPGGWHDNRDYGSKSGQHCDFYVWYARRIEPEPFDGQVRYFPCELPRKDGPQYVCDSDSLWYVQRQYHNGEWRDVGVQE